MRMSIAAAGVVLLTCALAACAAKEPVRRQAATHHKLIIRPIQAKQWEASPRDVEKVLRSAANELWVYFPGRELKPILVGPKGGPIVWFKRGPKAEYNVRLSTGKTYWSQYAFQFAHEFCHILCNYEPTQKANKWFEESLCETAALFALRRMALTWSLQPPYPNWRDYSSALWKYADDRIKKFRLPQGHTLAKWYRGHQAELRKKSGMRDKNGTVAVALLPLFEREPRHWAAVQYLNASPSRKPRSFQHYLAAWQKNSPEEHRLFIRAIAGKLGIKLPSH